MFVKSLLCNHRHDEQCARILDHTKKTALAHSFSCNTELKAMYSIASEASKYISFILVITPEQLRTQTLCISWECSDEKYSKRN